MHSDSAKYDAYLNALDDSIVNEIRGMIQSYAPTLKERLWDVFSLTCDLAPDETIYKVGLRKCPRCGSTSLSREADKVEASIEVPAITHHAWGKLSAEEKRSRILAIG